MVVNLFLAGAWNSKEGFFWQKLLSSGNVINSLSPSGTCADTFWGLIVAARDSQKDRIIQVGRGLRRPPRPRPCSEQDQVNQVVQGFFLSSFECFQEWRFHNLSGPLFQDWTALMVTKLFLIPSGNKLALHAIHLIIQVYWPVYPLLPEMSLLVSEG